MFKWMKEEDNQIHDAQDVLVIGVGLLLVMLMDDLEALNNHAIIIYDTHIRISAQHNRDKKNGGVCCVQVNRDVDVHNQDVVDHS
jgi:hypothetical protein